MQTTTNGDTITLTVPAGAGINGQPYTGALLLCRKDDNNFMPTITVTSGSVTSAPVIWEQWNYTHDTTNAFDPNGAWQSFLWRACSPPLFFANPGIQQTIVLTVENGGATFCGAELYVAEQPNYGTLLSFGHSVVFGSFLGPNKLPNESGPARFPTKLATVLRMAEVTNAYPGQSMNDEPYYPTINSQGPPPGWLYVDDQRVWADKTPEIAVIMHGQNDNFSLDSVVPQAVTGFSVSRFQQRLRDAIYRMNLNSPKTLIVLAGVIYLDVEDGTGNAQLRVTTNNNLSALCSESNSRNCIYAEVRTPMLGYGNFNYTVTIPTTTTTYYPSLLMLQNPGFGHPNPLGTDVVARAIYERIMQSRTRPLRRAGLSF